MKFTELEALAKLRHDGLISDSEFEREKAKLLRGTDAPWKLFGIVALVLTAITSLGWYFGSPHWTLYQIDSALQKGDADRLVSYVDTDALKADLKEKFAAEMAEEAMESENPFALIGVGLADGLIDTMMTKANLVKMFKREFAEDGSNGLRDDLEITRLDFSRFKLGNGKGGFYFTRDGLSWKITGIDTPDEGSSQDATSDEVVIEDEESDIDKNVSSKQIAMNAADACKGHWRNDANGIEFYLDYTGRVLNFRKDGEGLEYYEMPYVVREDGILAENEVSSLFISCTGSSATMFDNDSGEELQFEATTT